MDRYFKVPMAAARAIVGSSDDADTLAAYVVLNRYAMPRQYLFTAAGAKAIRTVTGMTDFRSKQVLRNLLELRFGEHGTSFLIADTGQTVRNARKYELGQWDGEVAYLPDLLTQGEPAPLSRLTQADASPEVRRDALLVLLHAYARVDYANWLGIDPEAFIYANWAVEGVAHAGTEDFELGLYGKAGGLSFWLMREDTEGERIGKRNDTQSLFGTGEATGARFRDACKLLLDLGMLCRIAIVNSGRTKYPLWIFSGIYREALRRAGVTSDLGRLIYNAADAEGFDPDNHIIRNATNADAPARGTDLFFVVGIGDQVPTVKTIFAPLFHAPTPLNLEGLREIDSRAKDWMARLRGTRRRHHAA